MAGAMDDLLTNIEPARKLRKMLDERGSVDNQKQFKELAKRRFGRNWALALRMQDAGLSTALLWILKQATDQNSFQTRVFDMDVMSGNATRSFNRGLPSEGRAVESGGRLAYVHGRSDCEKQRRASSRHEARR